MKFAIVVGFLFLTILSAGAGTHTESFDDGDLGAWTEIIQHNDNPGAWDIIDNELQAISHGGFTRLLTLGMKRGKITSSPLMLSRLKNTAPGTLQLPRALKELGRSGVLLVTWPFPRLSLNRGAPVLAAICTRREHFSWAANSTRSCE